MFFFPKTRIPKGLNSPKIDFLYPMIYNDIVNDIVYGTDDVVVVCA